MRLWSILKLIYHIVRGVINPSDVMHAVRAGNVLCESGVIETSVQKIRSYPSSELFFKERNWQFNHGIEFFSKFPEGSVGKAYHDHLVANRLDPNAFPKTEIKDESTYLEHLVRHTHDIWHVLTGFDVSVAGEIGLQAFMAKQMNWPFSMIALSAGSLITLFKEPTLIEKLVDHIALGRQYGASASPLILVNWNEKWNLPLDQVKRELNLPV